MKRLIQFTVYGIDRQELEEKAVQVYRQYSGDFEAELPYSAVVEAKPVQDDSGIIMGWSADVTISMNTGSV